MQRQLQDEKSSDEQADVEMTPDDQAWFWTGEWQAGEESVERDKASGRIMHLSREAIQERIRAAQDAISPFVLSLSKHERAK